MQTGKKCQPRSQCVISNVLDIFGDKWTLLVIRDLLFFNKHEFKEFLSSPEAIATNILSDRLKRLLTSGVIKEKLHPENRSRKLYYLTEKGKALLPVMLEMAGWGARYFPDLPAMQGLYDALNGDREVLARQILSAGEEWERQHI